MAPLYQLGTPLCGINQGQFLAEHAFEAREQGGVFGPGEFRVGGDDFERVVAGFFEQAEVLDDAGDVQFRQAVLAGAEELTRAALAEVGFGDLEAVGSAGHDRQALGGFRARALARARGFVALRGPVAAAPGSDRGSLAGARGSDGAVAGDVAKKKRKDREAVAAGRELDKLATGLEWHKTLHKIKIPPMVHFKEAQIYCSAWLPIAVSFFTGWLAGILGIGGGLIRMPALIYFVGCPTHVAVGTDLFEVMISGLYGTGTYTYKGRTELVAAMIMLCGAAVGAQIGTVATKYIKGYGIRIAFGLCTVGCALSIILKMLAKGVPAYGTAFDVSATVLILGLVSAMSLYIFLRMLAGAKREIADKKAKAQVSVAS